MKKNDLFYAYINNSIEIELSRDCVENCCHSGECDEDCERWLEIPEIKSQFDKVGKTDLMLHILEYDCHEAKELDEWSKKKLAIWVLWSLCGDIFDSEEFNEEESEDD